MPEDEVQSKALFALSALSRDSEGGARALVDFNGLHGLALAMRQGSRRVVRKALVLLTDLAQAANTREDGDAAMPSLASSLADAVQRNASTLCGAMTSLLDTGAAEADVPTLEKALEAADAFLGTPRFSEHLVAAPAGPGITCGEALSASAGRVIATAEAAMHREATAVDSEPAVVEMWDSLRRLAARLHVGLDGAGQQ